MNLWECQHEGCKSTAVGVGGAVGLRAIGWYFVRGPVIFCPKHRPDFIEVCTEYPAFRNCSICPAIQKAQHIQAVIDRDFKP